MADQENAEANSNLDDSLLEEGNELDKLDYIKERKNLRIREIERKHRRRCLILTDCSKKGTKTMPWPKTRITVTGKKNRNVKYSQHCIKISWVSIWIATRLITET